MSRSSSLLSTRAYLKLILHSAKYQSRAVLGLLIGSHDSSSHTTTVRDIYPLFHTASPLPPAIEVALTQGESLASKTGESIVGLYYAPELFDVRAHEALQTPHANVAIKIAEKINENVKGTAQILILDSIHLAALGSSSSLESIPSALEVFHSSGSSKTGWTHSGAAKLLQADGKAGAKDDLVSQLRSLLKEEKQRLLSDFDDHLDDAKADWTNVEFDKNVLPTIGAK